MAFISCPMCDQQVALADGRGAPGEKRFECPRGHVFGPGGKVEQPPRRRR